MIPGRPNPPPVAYRFSKFCLQPADRRLFLEGEPVSLPPKVFDVLLILVSSHGRLVEKDEFFKQVWQDSFVEEVALAHAVSQLRKALREGSDDSKFIETVPKRGYRFLASVEADWGESAEAQSRVTVAVLPFEDLGGGSEREYLADGLTEEVIASLGQLDPDHLGVIGRTSIMSYKRTTKTLAAIGRELGTLFLVESSIRDVDGRMRITSRLIRAGDQVQIWCESYDRDPGSVLEFQRDLSKAIAHQVRLRLSPERLNAMARRQTQQVEAYDFYLRGRYFWHQLSAQTTRRAIEFYTRATELDPGYALAWAGLGDAYAAGPINGDAPPLRMWPLARAAAANANAAGPDLAEAQNALAFVKFWLDWDWIGAETAFRRAIALDPSYALAHRTLAIALSHMERNEEARTVARRAVELDPLHAGHHALSSQVAFNAGDYPAAIQFARQATILDPEFWVGYIQLAQVYEQLGNSDLAFDALQNAWRFSGGNSKAMSLRGYILAKLGRTSEAMEVLGMLQSVPKERYVPPYATALVYAGLGRKDAALEWLERAYDMHDVHLAFLPVDPKWDTFRSDGRFLTIVDRCAFTSGGTKLMK